MSEKIAKLLLKIKGHVRKNWENCHIIIDEILLNFLTNAFRLREERGRVWEELYSGKRLSKKWIKSTQNRPEPHSTS